MSTLSPVFAGVPEQRTPSVADVVAAGQAVHLALEQSVLRARMQGSSWAAVARALGCSRSAAHERWRYVDDLWDQVAVIREADGGLVFAPAAGRQVIDGVVLHPQDLTPAGLRAGLDHLARVQQLEASA